MNDNNPSLKTDAKALEVQNLFKQFQDKQVLQGLNLTLKTGEIYGFVGKNGAGKTTAMRIILGLETANSGSVHIAGRPVHFGSAAANRQVGYLSDVPAFYDYLSAEEYLTLCGRVTGIPASALANRVQAMIATVGLNGSGHQRIRGFSRGMKQRLGIAQALLNDPQLLICDEPTSALDPEGRHDFLQLIANLRTTMTILLSTHILTDMEELCDRVGFVDHGRLVEEGSLQELRAKYAHPLLRLGFADAAQAQQAQRALAPLLQLQPEQSKQAGGISFSNSPSTSAAAQYEISLPYSGSYEQTAHLALQTLLKAGVTPARFEQVNPSLDDVFMEVVG
ncbi:ABC transporter ATP-binding protein [Bombiscardovia nodaiensis]|uniref:ABC transporter ATP-binding protein n=1 Tax=Bombiscardovia nodaiensis TaxID=2932181 RepID=A0ABM8B6T2_9BIFI|nr:ABC transporter ATP-binding protein [Bombiscardovia nodaiensis]